MSESRFYAFKVVKRRPWSRWVLVCASVDDPKPGEAVSYDPRHMSTA